MCEQHLSDEERDHRPRGAAGFVDELVVAITNCRIYSKGHPRLESALQDLSESFAALARDAEGGRVELGQGDGFLFYARRPLLGATLSSRRLIEPLSALQSGGLAFDRDTTREDLNTLAAFMCRGCKGATTYMDANMELATRGCTHIHFLPPYKNVAGTWSDEDRKERIGLDTGEDVLETVIDLDISKQLYQDVVGVLQDAMVRSCRGEGVETEAAGSFVSCILAELAKDAKSMMRLARYEKYDAFTFGHSIRVCFIALNFARHLTQDTRLLERIGLAALMHDIGKAWVPFEVLHSRNRLTAAERTEMNRHTVHGGQILLGSRNPDPLSVAVAFSHHQNYRGGGYPASVRASRQSTSTMIVKLSDVYEALTAVRPYKPRMSPTRAYRIMMSMEGHFEPSLLRKFIAVNGIYPAGSRVRLTTGEIARVAAQSDSLLHPVVTTETASTGQPLWPEDVLTIDLSKQDGKNPVQVVEMLHEPEM